MLAIVPSEGICFRHPLPNSFRIHFHALHAPEGVPSASTRGSSKVKFVHAPFSSSVQFGRAVEIVPSSIPANTINPDGMISPDEGMNGITLYFECMPLPKLQLRGPCNKFEQTSCSNRNRRACQSRCAPRSSCAEVGSRQKRSEGSKRPCVPVYQTCKRGTSLGAIAYKSSPQQCNRPCLERQSHWQAEVVPSAPNTKLVGAMHD